MLTPKLSHFKITAMRFRHGILSFLLLCISQSKAQVTPEEIIQDIDQLVALIEKEHVSPYWNNSKANFLEGIQIAKNKIREKENCDEQCFAEILKIVALLKESHSYVSSSSRYEVFGYLPVSFKWFEDGLYVIRVSEEHAEILGHQLVSINGKSVESIIEKMREVIPHSNVSRIKKYIGSYLHLPGLLFGLGISKSADETKYIFNKSGIQIERTIGKLSPEEEDQTVFKSVPTTEAYFQKNRELYYWFEHVPSKNLVYFQYNRIGNMDSESSTAFANRLWATVDSVKVDKFVLDLRYNGGGSFPYSLKFIQGIINRPEINKRGKLFVITGFDTFSAAITMVNQLEQRTEAIIVGDYPCASPSHPGDPENYKLDNTGITVSLSSLFHPSFYKGDRRNATLLDKRIEAYWKDYSKGIDPVMDFVMNYQNEAIELGRTEDDLKWLGIYEYSAIRNLEIGENKGNFYLKIDEQLYSPLYIDKMGFYSTEVIGLRLSFEDEAVVLHFPDDGTKKFKRIEKRELSAIDYLYSGELKKAEKIYLDLKASDPDNLALKDHQLSFLASIIYFDLSDNPNSEASNIAKGILNMGIMLNEGKAPFCKFSLRFY